MPSVDQSLEQLQQNRDIIEMQSGGWFVENKKIADGFFCRGSRAGCIIFLRRRHAFISGGANEFWSLGPAAAQGIEWLPQPQIPEPHLLQNFERVRELFA